VAKAHRKTYIKSIFEKPKPLILGYIYIFVELKPEFQFLAEKLATNSPPPIPKQKRSLKLHLPKAKKKKKKSTLGRASTSYKCGCQG
jgi:hypothetical protein